MKYLDPLKHWSTYFFAFSIEIVTTRAQLYFCFRRKDYGCIFGNLMIMVWWIVVASVLRYFYLRQKGKQINTKTAYPSAEEK